MLRRQQMITGFRSGWRNASGTGRAVTMGAGLGIALGLVACFVMLIT